MIINVLICNFNLLIDKSKGFLNYVLLTLQEYAGSKCIFVLCPYCSLEIAPILIVSFFFGPLVLRLHSELMLSLDSLDYIILPHTLLSLALILLVTLLAWGLIETMYAHF